MDDGSTDNTLQLAQGAGAKVISAGALPDGWAGKAHACWVGAESALNDVLVFVDADVRFNTANKYIVRGLASSVVSQPTALFSVQPWHNTVQIGEQASMLFNIVSVMGSGMKTSKPLVFGPLLACMREVYVANHGPLARKRARSSGGRHCPWAIIQTNKGVFGYAINLHVSHVSQRVLCGVFWVCKKYCGWRCIGAYWAQSVNCCLVCVACGWRHDVTMDVSCIACSSSNVRKKSRTLPPTCRCTFSCAHAALHRCGDQEFLGRCFTRRGSMEWQNHSNPVTH